MHVIIAAIGTGGDVFPFVGLGRALAGRGHRVTLLANEHFAGMAKAHQIDFAAAGSAAHYREATGNPLLWTMPQGITVFSRTIVAPSLRPVYDYIAAHREPGTVVVGSVFAFSARCAQEALGVKQMTAHISPSMFRSGIRPPHFPGMQLSVLTPIFAWPLVWWLIDRTLMGPFSAVTNEFRQSVGMPPVNRVMDRWLHSPRRTVGLFPRWFAPPQRDWPSGVTCTGFPLYDTVDGAAGIPAECRAFLAAGDKPVVFTPGTGVRSNRAFFLESLAALERIGGRGLFLTRYREQVPSELPATVRCFDYVPLSSLLRETAAIVHHGGIGTTSQALAAGIPQLVVPMVHDQHDNGYRVKALGTGDTIDPRQYAAGRVFAKIRRLLCSDKVARSCRRAKDLIAAEDGMGAWCDAVEKMNGA